MNCPRNLEVSAYLDDAMEPDERSRFNAHLHTCPLCHGRLDEMTTLQKQLRDLPSPVLRFDMAARLQDQIRADEARRRTARSFRPGWNIGGLMGGLAVAASIASGVWLGGMLIGGTVLTAQPAAIVRVFDPVPPGGLCAAAELCRVSKGLQ